LDKNYDFQDDLPLKLYKNTPVSLSTKINSQSPSKSGRETKNGEFFLAPSLSPKPEGVGIYYSHHELAISYFVSGIKDGVGLHKIGHRKLYLGEFRNDKKHGIGSCIEGTDLKHTLDRILLPVNKMTANLQKNSLDSKLNTVFELEGIDKNYNSHDIIYGSKDVITGRVFNGQYVNG
jgi:hypothetical protein